MPLKIIRRRRQKKKKISDSRNTSTAQEMGEICEKLVFSTFVKVNKELKVTFGCKKQDLTRNLVPGRKQAMFYSGPSFQTPLAWLGESAENRSWPALSGRNPDRQLRCGDGQCGQRGIWMRPTVWEGGRNGPHGNWRSEILHLEGKLSWLLSARNVKLFEKTNTMT